MSPTVCSCGHTELGGPCVYVAALASPDPPGTPAAQPSGWMTYDKDRPEGQRWKFEPAPAPPAPHAFKGGGSWCSCGAPWSDDHIKEHALPPDQPPAPSGERVGASGRKPYGGAQHKSHCSCSYLVADLHAELRQARAVVEAAQTYAAIVRQTHGINIPWQACDDFLAALDTAARAQGEER